MDIITETLLMQLDPAISIPSDLLTEVYQDLVANPAMPKKQQEQYLKAFAALSDGYTIDQNGALVLQGNSGTYRVNGDFCYRTNVRKSNGKHGDDACRGFLRSGGNCYHVYAFTMVMTAQQRSHTTPSTVPPCGTP